MGPRQEARKVAEAAEKQGFAVKVTKRGHYQFFAADGTFICDLGGTPGSQREITNKISALRRYGFRYGKR